jgi:hypothetical protein
MRDYSRSIIIVAAFVAAVVNVAQAQTAVDPSGHWEGTVQVPDMPVKVEVDLIRNSNGTLAGAFNQPGQLTGLPLAILAFENRSLTFQIKGSATGERLFKGDVSADGLSISGMFAQAGYSMPFVLTRTGDARIEAPARSARIDKALEGTWSGTLEVRGVQRQLVLTMANQPDGTSTGTLLNVEESLEIPIGAITQTESKVALEIKAVSGSYSGALNADATELAGTLTQGSVTLPLTFRKR